MIAADVMEDHCRTCMIDVVIFTVEQRLAKLEGMISREIEGRRGGQHGGASPAGSTTDLPLRNVTYHCLTLPIVTSLSYRDLPLPTVTYRYPPLPAGSADARKDALLQLLHQTAVEVSSMCACVRGACHVTLQPLLALH